MYLETKMTNAQLLEWKDDIIYLTDKLIEIHPDLYRQVSKEDFICHTDKLISGLNKTNIDEIKIGLMKLLSKLKDGHTLCYGQELANRWFPIRIEKFLEGYFITSISKDYSDLLGCQVLEMGKYDINEVFELLKEIISGDNSVNRTYYAKMYLTMSSVLKGIEAIKNHKELQLTIQKEKGVTKKVTIESNEYKEDIMWFFRHDGIPYHSKVSIADESKDLPNYIKLNDIPFHFKLLNEYKAAYLIINQLISNKHYNFDEFNSMLWKSLNKNNINHLIIDLRNNHGGNNFLNYLILHEIIKNNSINRKGHLHILVSEKTFSAAIHLVVLLEIHCKPIIYGENTSGSPNHFGDSEFLALPNSGIKIMISKYYWQCSFPFDDREFISPFYGIENSITNYPKSDKVFEKALQVIEDENNMLNEL